MNAAFSIGYLVRAVAGSDHMIARDVVTVVDGLIAETLVALWILTFLFVHLQHRVLYSGFATV